MEIYVKMLEPKTTTFKVDSSDTVDGLKVKTYEMDDTCPAHQPLIFGCHQMDDNRTLASYNVQNEFTIYLVLCLCGC